MSLAQSKQELPEVRGRYSFDTALGEGSWFRCGGKADVLFKPADLEDLQNFLTHCDKNISVSVFGVMSNVIIRDGGVPGVTIRLGREFSDIKVDGEYVRAGALALDANVAKLAAEHGIAGLEFLSGIPGTIGGALKMNAGCYGSETKDVLVECQALDGEGNLITLIPCHPERSEGSQKIEGDPSSQAPQDDKSKILMPMSYRHTDIPDDYILVNATFKGGQENPDTILKNIEDIKSKREGSQPIREKTGGSTFANPSALELSQAGLRQDMKVWELIDQVGGRGLKIGGAQMSEKHCNFMINTGNASATDLEHLGEEIRKRVYQTFGIDLRWEIKRVGRPLES